MLKRLILAGLLAISFACQAAVFSLPWGPKPQFVDANGAPMSGGTLSTFLATSTTPQVTYTDSTGGVANPTTITLNVRGESPNEVWLTGGVAYKFVLKDSAGSTVWTIDNISGVNDVTSALDEWKAGPTPTFVSATSFTLVGDQTVEFHKGRRLKTTNSGGTVYSTITASVFGATTTVTVANDSSILDSGLSAVSYGIIRAANPSISPDMGARKGTAVTSAGTTDIWSIAGDYVHVTGTTTITSFSTAPYAGARRIVIFDGALTLTNGTNLKLPGGQNIPTAVNDRAWVVADTTTAMTVLSYDRAFSLPAQLAPMSMQGLTYANNGTDSIDVAVGVARDATNAMDISLASALTKQTNNAWAVGTAAGCLDTGAVANSDYYLWAIKRSDTGVVDALCSLSSTAPTMPANYDFKRLFGWYKRVGGVVVAFHTYETEGGGIEMRWDVPTLDVNLANTLTTARRTDAVKVPLNFSVVADLNVTIEDALTAIAWVYCPDHTDAAPSATVAPLASLLNAGGISAFSNMLVRTSSAGLIAARSNTATVDLYAVVTQGFRWARRN